MYYYTYTSITWLNGTVSAPKNPPKKNTRKDVFAGSSGVIFLFFIFFLVGNNRKKFLE